MSDIEMFHVGENENGEKLYNLRYVNTNYYDDMVDTAEERLFWGGKAKTY